MNTENVSVDEARKRIHLAQAHLLFYLYKAGNRLATAKGYGGLKGIDAIARFLLERDGTPIERTLSASYESLKTQLSGELSKYDEESRGKIEPGSLDEATMNLLLAEAELAALLEEFGDELGQREKLDVDGLEAIRVYLMHKHGFELAMLEALSPSALRKYLSKEMKGWTAGSGKNKGLRTAKS